MSEKFLLLSRIAPFQEVLPRSSMLNQPPRFFFGTFPAEIATLYFTRLQMTAVGVYTCRDVELSDGFLMYHEGDLLEAADCKVLARHLASVPAARKDAFAGRPRRRVPGRVAWVTSPGYKTFGSWLTEILPRLAVLEAAGMPLAKLVFAVPADTPDYGLELLHLCGVPKSRMIIYGEDEVLQPDELLVPTLLHNGVRYAPLMAEAVALIRRGVQKAGHSLVSDSAPSRIYLAHASASRRPTNREALQAIAEAAGFTFVQPETMSLPEQMTMFASAREIAGEYGSAFHTAMFSPPGTIVCGLRGSHLSPGLLQTALGDVLDQPTGYVFGQSATAKPSSDYTIDEKHFADCLRTVFCREANLSTHVKIRRMKEQPPQFPPPEDRKFVPPRRNFWDLLAKRPARHDGPVAPGSLYGDLLNAGDEK